MHRPVKRDGRVAGQGGSAGVSRDAGCRTYRGGMTDEPNLLGEYLRARRGQSTKDKQGSQDKIGA